MAKLGLDIKALLKPSPEKAKDRNVRGLPLNGLWIPFFTATNATGESSIAHSALGAPMQLVVNKDGTPKVKVDDDGTERVQYKVNKAVNDSVKTVMDNFAFGLMAFTETVKKTHLEQYKAEVEAARVAGATIRAHEDMTLGQYMASKAAQAANDAPPATEAPKTETRELVAA